MTRGCRKGIVGVSLCGYQRRLLVSGLVAALLCRFFFVVTAILHQQQESSYPVPLVGGLPVVEHAENAADMQAAVITRRHRGI
jgi:hypothetical protein